MKIVYGKALLLLAFLLSSVSLFAQELYEMPDSVQTRWSSFENADARKGAGGMENKGAKGHAFDQVKAGQTVTLLNVQGAGVIKKIWMTINDRSPKMLRSLRIDMYWDGASKPAVSAPLGDFFGIGMGRLVSFENALFSDPEGRSFNCYIPMPFKKGAKVTVTNESTKDLDLFFYDIDFLKKPPFKKKVLYFHTFWHRQHRTELKHDFEILPRVQGAGRYLGANIGVIANKAYKNTWFGEGEVKMYLDGDGQYPTLVGTGTEDYIGTGWGEGTYNHEFQGSLIADKEKEMFAFYRYHVPDPIFFHKNIKVTIQQIGGGQRDTVRALVKNGAPLIPISSGNAPNFVKVLEQHPVPNLNDPDFPTGWTNFYRSDDVSATAYFYLDKPVSNLPKLGAVNTRTADLHTAQTGNPKN